MTIDVSDYKPTGVPMPEDEKQALFRAIQDPDFIALMQRLYSRPRRLVIALSIAAGFAVGVLTPSIQNGFGHVRDAINQSWGAAHPSPKESDASLPGIQNKVDLEALTLHLQEGVDAMAAHEQSVALQVRNVRIQYCASNFGVQLCHAVFDFGGVHVDVPKMHFDDAWRAKDFAPVRVSGYHWDPSTVLTKCAAAKGDASCNLKVNLFADEGYDLGGIESLSGRVRFTTLHTKSGIAEGVLENGGGFVKIGLGLLLDNIPADQLKGLKVVDD